MAFDLPTWVPDWLFILSYPSAALVLLWIVHRTFKRFAPNWRLEDRDENMAAGGIASAVAISGIVLAFVLAQTTQASDTYQADVTVEAAQIRALGKQLNAYSSEEATTCQPLLLAYTNSIVSDEWPMLAQQTGSAITTNKLKALDQCLVSLKSTDTRQIALYVQLLNTSDKLAQLRETRIINSGASLSGLFWGVMHLGLFLIVIVTALAFYTPGPIRVINCSIQIISLSLLYALVLILDHPFSGANAVSSAPILDTISHLTKKN